MEFRREKPLKEVIEELRSNRQLMETLEPLNLTERALITTLKFS